MQSSSPTLHFAPLTFLTVWGKGPDASPGLCVSQTTTTTTTTTTTATAAATTAATAATCRTHICLVGGVEVQTRGGSHQPPPHESQQPTASAAELPPCIAGGAHLQRIAQHGVSEGVHKARGPAKAMAARLSHESLEV
eukprot:349682-Chlamydomonas_euryale.AAC.1